jgi:hypothetical protein
MGRLVFRTMTQKVLFEHEIKGQLSDGHWENSYPQDHWRPWCDAKVEVGPNVGRDFHARRTSYVLNSKSLLDVVAQRMIAYCRIALRFGEDKVELYEKLLGLDGEFRGPPDYADYGKSTYWTDIRKKLADAPVDEIRAAVEDEKLYTRRQLIVDLKEMRQAMATWATEAAHG